MNEKEKLLVLIPHWIEHNEEHADEFRQWAKKAGDAGPELMEAANAVQQVNLSLKTALEKIS
jgi:hypothetical protein